MMRRLFRGGVSHQGELAKVNPPVADLVWLMILPRLLKVDPHGLKGVTRHWRGVGVTLFANWAIKPFSMTLIGWLFIGGVFRPWLPAEQIESNIAELIILVAVLCTAIADVFIEVPVMLMAEDVVNRTRDWYEARVGVVLHEQCYPTDQRSYGGY